MSTCSLSGAKVKFHLLLSSLVLIYEIEWKMYDKCIYVNVVVKDMAVVWFTDLITNTLLNDLPGKVVIQIQFHVLLLMATIKYSIKWFTWQSCHIQFHVLLLMATIKYSIKWFTWQSCHPDTIPCITSNGYN